MARVDDLPAAAVSERREFQLSGVKSKVCVPMAYGGKAVGCLGFDSVHGERAWSEDVVRLLKIVGEMFANALEHQRAQGEIRRSEARFRGIFQNASIGIGVFQINGEPLETNQAVDRIIGYSREERAQHSFVGIHPPRRPASPRCVGRGPDGGPDRPL